SSLSDEQKILLQYYIETGGNVLVGTGQNADLAVKGFSSYFTSPPSSIVSKIGAQNILMEKYTAEDLYYVSLQDEQLTEIDWFKCQREIAKNSYEEIGGLYKNKTYSIYFTSWDLAQTTFSQWIGASDYIKNMILSNITTESQFTFLPDAYSFDALKLIPENAYPNVTVLILILAGYTILTGPVLYIVFKKLKKREALWIAIPSVVVLFCAVVFCYGYIVRGGGNISSSVSIVELNSSEQKPIIQATSVMTAKQGDMSLDFGKNTIFYNKYDDSLERVFYQGEDAKEVVKGVTMWSFADATASREISQYFGVLDVQVSYNDDGSTNQIMITNNSEYDISNIIVYADGKFGIVSTLNRYATETVKPNEPDIFNALSQAYFGVDNGALSGTNNFPANYYYYNSVYNNGTSLNLPDSATADEQIRASLMYTFLNTVSHSGTGNIVVAGFAEAGNEVFPLHVNGKKPAKQRNNTLVYQVVKKEKGKLYSMNVSNEQVGIETLENVTGTQNIYNESIHDVFPLTVNGTSSAMYFEIVLPQNMFLSGAKVSVYVESPEARQMEIYIGGTPVEFSTNTEFVLPLDVKTYLNFYYNYPQSTYYNNVNQDIHVKGIWQNILQGTQFISFYINFPDSKPWTIDNILYSVTLDD
ncbi:MAG: hypothetical protein LBI03_01640, partial [Clostridiales bacterium]|nr:hypothetical protein [Clostridiales bacterium]